MLLFRSERLLGASRPFWVWALAVISVVVSLLPLLFSWWFHGSERYDWLRGSSQWGIFFGVVGGWLIIFEMLYWVRKKGRGYPSNYLTRENVSGWPVGTKPLPAGVGRALLHLPLLVVFVPLGIFSSVGATVLSSPLLRGRYQRGLDGSITRDTFFGLRERLIHQTQSNWQRIKLGLFLPVAGLMFIFQIVPLGVVWLLWAARAKSWVKPIVMTRFGCRTNRDVRNLDPARRAVYNAALSDAVHKERLKISRFIFPTQIWLIGHILFGFLSLVAIVYHTGYRWGGSLSMCLSILFYLVILSGVWGLWMQQFRPRQLRDEIDEETIASQVDFVSAQRVPEAERIFQDLTGLSWQHEFWETSTEKKHGHGEHDEHGGHNAIGQPIDAPIRDVAARELQRFFRTQLLPYLLGGRGSRTELKSGDKSARLFNRLRMNLPQAAHPQVAMLEGLADYRRQLDLQANLNWWLHGWLYFHLSLSVAMFVLMIVHVFVAFKLVW